MIVTFTKLSFYQGQKEEAFEGTNSWEVGKYMVANDSGNDDDDDAINIRMCRLQGSRS